MKYLVSLAIAALSFSHTVMAVSIAPQAIDVTAQLAYPIQVKSKEQHNYLKIAFTGDDSYHLNERSPINVALVIDRSGSMQGDKIRKARDAAILAVDMLRHDDIISVVGYDFSAQVIIPATRLNNKQQLKNRIREAIRADGNTALFAGVSKGMKEVKKYLSKNKVNRVILLSDGQANVGPSSTSELGELGLAAAKQGITVSTIGLGEGYNEDLMTALAGYSDGNHFFVQNATDLVAAFDREFKDVMNVVAQNVTVDIYIKHGKPQRLLGREGRIRGQYVSVKLNQIYANQEKYILLDIAPTNSRRRGEKVVADINISYNPRGSKTSRPLKRQVSVLYTDNPALAEQAINENVLADFFIQQSNVANIKAIQALDAGNKEKAEAILESAYHTLSSQADKFSSPVARSKISGKSADIQQTKEATMSAPVQKARKILKESDYKTKKQQK